MAPPLIVFDLDGTLVDSAPDLLATLNAVLPAHGFQAIADPKMHEGIGHGARHLIVEALKRHGVTPADDALDAVHGDFLAHYEANICRHSQLYPGAEAMLDRFAAAGWRLAVCTNKKESLSRQLLEALGVAERFAAICGGDTFAAPKPDPAHLGGTIAASSGAADRAIMLGDSVTDLDAARAMRVPFVGVSFGYTQVPMAKLGPDRLIDGFDALSPETANELLAAHADAPAAPQAAPADP